METKIYLATESGLAVIASSNDGWRGDIQLRDRDIKCVAVDRNRPEAVLCGSFGNGVFQSDDAGANWQQCEGTNGENVRSLAVSDVGSFGESRRIYAGTEPSSILRSDDNGKTWRRLSKLLELPSASMWSFPPRPETHHVRYILPDPYAPRRLHVAIEAGALLRSDDEGETWRDRVPTAPRDTHILAADPEIRGKLYSAAGDGYFESSDDGDNWRRISDGLDHTYCWSIAIGFADREIILLTASRTARDAHSKASANSFLYRRSQQTPWQKLQHGLPDSRGRRIAIVCADQLGPRVFYLYTEGEVYRSADNGSHWKLLTVQWADGSRPEHAVDMRIVGHPKRG